MNSTDTITITWHIDDVRRVRPDLCDDDCREVLSWAASRHDAETGINWEVLLDWADKLFPKDADDCRGS